MNEKTAPGQASHKRRHREEQDVEKHPNKKMTPKNDEELHEHIFFSFRSFNIIQMESRDTEIDQRENKEF